MDNDISNLRRSVFGVNLRNTGTRLSGQELRVGAEVAPKPNAGDPRVATVSPLPSSSTPSSRFAPSPAPMIPPMSDRQRASASNSTDNGRQSVITMKNPGAPQSSHNSFQFAPISKTNQNVLTTNGSGSKQGALTAPSMNGRLTARDEMYEDESNGQANALRSFSRASTALELPVAGISSAAKDQAAIRTVCLSRRSSGSFGIALKEITIVRRETRLDGSTIELPYKYFIVEPAADSNSTQLGLLPGDVLLAVNGISVANCTREQVVRLISESPLQEKLQLAVQTLPEMTEINELSLLRNNSVAPQDPTDASALQASALRKRTESRAADRERNDFQKGEKVWLRHRSGYAPARLIDVDDGGSQGRGRVKVDNTAQDLAVTLEHVDKMNPLEQDRVDNLASLRFVNESAVLHVLRQRYAIHLFHTFAGPHLLAVNPTMYGNTGVLYSERTALLFKGVPNSQLPPHVFAVAERAYREMIRTDRSQSICLIGRAGSGKTISLLQMMRYFTMCYASDALLAASSQTDDHAYDPPPLPNHVAIAAARSRLVERIESAMFLLAAFGGTRTCLNATASRFACLATLEFDQRKLLSGLSFQVYLFERNRLYRRPDGEPAFHVLYHMIAGLSTERRNELHLNELSGSIPNLFITPLQRNEDRQRATQYWCKVERCFSLLEFGNEEQRIITSLLAAIYHLGETNASDMDQNDVDGGTAAWRNREKMARAAQLLGADPVDLERVLFASASSVGVGDAEQRRAAALMALEGFAIGLYTEVFSLIVSLINRCLLKQSKATFAASTQLHVLDLPGFQHPQTAGRNGGATFDDLLFNYAHERLIAAFAQHAIAAYHDRYAAEHVELADDTNGDLLRRTLLTVAQQSDALVGFLDRPASLLKDNDALHGSPDSSADQNGAFWIIDQEAQLREATLEGRRSDASRKPPAPYTPIDTRSPQELADDALEERLVLRLAAAHRSCLRAANDTRLHENSEAKRLMQRVRDAPKLFYLQHLNHSCPVMYNADGWLRSCFEHPNVMNIASDLCKISRNSLLLTMLVNYGSDQTLPAVLIQQQQLAQFDPGDLNRRTSRLLLANNDLRVPGLRKSSAAIHNLASVKRRSLAAQTKLQVDMLLDALSKTNVHFIFNVLPQTNAGLAEIKQRVQENSSASEEAVEQMLNVPLIRSQLHAYHTLPALFLYRFGYPESRPFREFRQLFEPFVNARAHSSSRDGSKFASPLKRLAYLGDDKDETESLLCAMDVDTSTYRLGTTRVFMQAGMLNSLLHSRDAFVADKLTRVQAYARGQLARRRYEKRKQQDEAIACIQRNYQTFSVLRKWNWWQLYRSLRPLLTVQKAEDELQVLRDEIAALKRRVAKLDAEKTEFRNMCENLELKLAELQTQCATEQERASRNGDLLEVESRARLRSEKELHEVNEKLAELRKHLRAAEDRAGNTTPYAPDLVKAVKAALANQEPLNYTPDEDQEELDYKVRCVQLQMEVDGLRKRMKDHQEELDDELGTSKRSFERKLNDAGNEKRLMDQEVAALRTKLAKQGNDLQELKAINEELRTKQNDFERREKRLLGDVSNADDQAKTEKELRERVQRDALRLLDEKKTVEQELARVKQDLERANRLRRTANFSDQLTVTEEPLIRALESHGVRAELGSAAAPGSSSLLSSPNRLNSANRAATPSPFDGMSMEQLRTLCAEQAERVRELEQQVDEDETHLDELERSRSRLEASIDKLKQQHTKELEEKDAESADVKNSAQKRIKQLETQLEDEQAEKQKLIREKRETERQIAELINQVPKRDREAEKRLLKDLKRYKALLKDAQDDLESAKQDTSTRNMAKHLRSQLEGLEAERDGALKARHGVELEIEDLHQQLVDATRDRNEMLDRVAVLQRENGELQSAVEERETETQFANRKYKNLLQQQGIDQQTIATQSKEIFELQTENELLKAKVTELEERVAAAAFDKIEKSDIIKLESRIRDLENRLELERTARLRAENQHERTREQITGFEREKRSLNDAIENEMEKNRKLLKQLREMKDEHADTQHRGEDAERKKNELQTRLNALEHDYQQAQNDLRNAFRRIAELQALLDEDMENDSNELNDDSSLNLSDEDKDENLHFKAVGSPSAPKAKRNLNASTHRSPLSPRLRSELPVERQSVTKRKRSGDD